jgi:PAS domain S-box-containing protein
MIVEDEGLIANDIAGQLQKCGYEPAAICSSGEEAIAAVAAGRLDLVLMDIRLKGELDGIEAARRIRAEFHLPVIFLTSHADADTLSRAKMAEPFGYLIKPFRALSLSGAIEMALYKHHTERIAAEREAWLTTVLQSTAEPTIVTDAGGAIQFLNTRAEELLGRAFADIAGTPWDQVTVIQDASGTRVDDLLSLATLRMSVVRFPAGSFLWKSDGQSVAVEGEVAPSLSKGNIAGAVITLRSATAPKPKYTTNKRCSRSNGWAAS